jgi:hypothetical protein
MDMFRQNDQKKCPKEKNDSEDFLMTNGASFWNQRDKKV